MNTVEEMRREAAIEVACNSEAWKELTTSEQEYVISAYLNYHKGKKPEIFFNQYEQSVFDHLIKMDTYEEGEGLDFWWPLFLIGGIIVFVILQNTVPIFLISTCFIVLVCIGLFAYFGKTKK